MGLKEQLMKIGAHLWELPAGAKPGMRVPAWLFLSERLLGEVEEGAVAQVANVACLPGIHRHSVAMPDMHFGYGFPIGGVAALDYEEGGLSPGGIGFDINCGVRLLRTNLTVEDVRPRLREMLERIFRNVPSGVGERGKVRLTLSQLDGVLAEGAGWAVGEGYGRERDLDHLEEEGCMREASPEVVSSAAKQRGAPQLGTLGGGNHFLEIQRVDKVYLPQVAEAMGIGGPGGVSMMIHTGSRGLGHQVCTDYLKTLESSFRDLVKRLPDRELIYAPSRSRECERYFKAMACAANYAWANRQMITHWVRESVTSVVGRSEEEAGLETVYDVAHNIAKVESHRVDGGRRKVYVHRKGATRAFGPGSGDIPQDYAGIGQPVLIPGSMGTASYVLVGTERAEEETFSSVCHGAGRMQSRASALRRLRGEEVKSRLEGRGILLRAASWKVIAEEAPEVYKDVDEVVRVCEEAGICRIVARLTPMGVVKG